MEVDLSNLDAMVAQIQDRKDKIVRDKEDKLNLILRMEHDEQLRLNA